MTKEEVFELFRQKNYPGSSEDDQLIETHISWLILSRDFAFKIKKPIQYSFLDFSTVNRRHYYCSKELRLNQRLTEGMYLDVLPIMRDNGNIVINGTEGQILDYTLKMRRMDESRQMNVLLEKGLVNKTHMTEIARQLANFHKKAKVIKTHLNLHLIWMAFADILKADDFFKMHLGKSARKNIKRSVKFSRHFLKRHRKKLLNRHEKGMTIDGHGDLHSKNIFLLDKPVIFDCIEFNNHFRQIDVLNELAFFCMDLNFFGREDLEQHFLGFYNAQNQCFFDDDDQQIFLFYKMYRANVKVKVNALKAMQAELPEVLDFRVGLMKKYFRLMKGYLHKLKA